MFLSQANTTTHCAQNLPTKTKIMTNSVAKNWKTVLFVPADKPKYLASALRIKPDAVQLDLEDSIHPSKKESARAMVQEACDQLREAGIACLVRVNNEPEHLNADLRSAVEAGVHAVSIPKLNSVADLKHIDDQLARLEQTANAGSINLLQHTKQQLVNQFEFKTNPMVEFKGIGKERSYSLLGAKRD